MAVRDADPRAVVARDPLTWLIAAIIVAAAIAAFAPALHGEFLNWDDDRNFLNNQSYRGLGWSPLRWMFTTAHMGHYIPVTWITLAVDYLVWGMNPFGYHLTNVLLHAANALFVYAIARRLLGAAAPAIASPSASAGEASSMAMVGAPLSDAGTPAVGHRSLSIAAAGAALLFAVHPLRVESVAWITERRDVLSGFFYLAAALAYLRAAAPIHGIRRRWYAISLAAFALALLSKSMAVSLPVVLLILDVYPLRRLRWPIGPAGRRVLIEKVPFVGLSLAVSGIALVALAGTGNMSDLARVSVGDRVAISLYSLAFYLWKSVVPIGLSPLYELPAGIDLRAWPFAASTAAVLALTTFAVAARRRWPAVAAAWAAYVTILLPVLGIVHNGHQIAADRYTYLATIPWAILVAGALRATWQRWARPAGLPIPRAALVGGRTALIAAPALCIAALLACAWTQSHHWRTTEALWRHALAVTPSALAYMNIGVMLDKRGQVAEAMAMHERALALRPDIAIVHVNAALTLSHQQRLPEAIRHLERALALKPRDAPTHTSLAAVLLQQGRWAEAADHAGRALLRDPAYPEAHNNLAAALSRLGDVDGAIRHYERALTERPSHDPGNFMVAVAQHNLGNALLRRGRVGEAVARLRQAVATQPTSAEMRNSLAVALARDGRFTEAAGQLEAAIRLDPTHAQARENLRHVQARLGAGPASTDASRAGSDASAPRP